MRKYKGGKIERLVGAAEAIGPVQAIAYWGWSVERSGVRVATGTSPTKRQAIQAIRRAITNALNGLDAYCVLEDKDDSIGSTEYTRTVDVFIPDK